MNKPMSSLVKTALAIALTGSTSVLGIRWIMQTRVRYSEMYKEAMECMRNNANVKDILGEPIREKRVDVGSWKYYGHDENKMWVSVPVKGPKRSGYVHYVVIAEGLEARRKLRLTKVEFQANGSKTRVTLKTDSDNESSPPSPHKESTVH